jgi:hypothetical protein
MRLEEIDIAEYKLEFAAATDAQKFKHDVKRNLEARRDRYCPKD